MGKIIFITGGARSGKSSFALESAAKHEGKRAYVATAQALDSEMKERIERHRKERGSEWDTFEEPMDLAKALPPLGSVYDVIIIDCLTIWLSNLMLSEVEVGREVEGLITALREVNTNVFVVSNEVGMGIVPDNETARRFRDMAGSLNQKVADAADEAYLVVSGIPVRIK
jgi:adenosylcobinamide kinase/adenosylcobinamide-phosphate guanylyltransferase